MLQSNKLVRTLSLPFLAMLMAFLPFSTASAHLPVTPASEAQLMENTLKIKIKIIIIIVIKKKGVVEVAGMRSAGEAKSLENNEVLADAYVENGQMFIMPLRGVHAKSQFLMPAGFQVSTALGRELGLKAGFSLKAGKFDLAPNKMGNFEIQD